MNILLPLSIIVLVAVATAAPAQDGAAYTSEAIRQAQTSRLIPQNAQIQNVQEGIELGAYESIPANQYIDLRQILGSEFPAPVIEQLQKQVNNIGQN